MDYKGYYISDVQSLLLYDMMQTQQEILAELKKLNGSVTDVRLDADVIPEDECIGLTEEVQEAVVQVTEQIEALSVKPTKKPAKAPAKRKPTKKKNAKKAVKKA
jgi:DNA-binding protein H-NS